MKEVIKKYKHNIRILIWFIILLLVSLSHFYSDTKSITRQGMLVWEALFSGNFFQYYSLGNVAVENGLMIHQCNYDMILNILMGLWQLPLYIIEKIIGGDILAYYPARVYAKLYLLILILLSGNVIKKIAIQMGISKDKTENVRFLFVSSVFVIISSVVASQIDIIGLFFILYAFYYLIKNEEIKFMLFFTLAVQCKFFAFFIFLPILLLREKRVWKLVVELIFPFILSVIVSIPFSLLDPSGVASKKERLAIMVSDMLGHKTYVLGFTIPTIFLIFAAICIIAYYIDLSEKDNKAKWYLYFGFLGIVGLFITLHIYPYWFIYFTPFITLFIFLDETKVKRHLFFETICSWSMAVGIVFSRYWCFSAFRIMLWGQLIPKCKPYLTIKELWDKYGHTSYYMAWTITYGIFAVWLILLLVYHCPCFWKKREQKLVTEDLTSYLWIRAIGNFLICNVGIILFLMGQVF